MSRNRNRQVNDGDPKEAAPEMPDELFDETDAAVPEVETAPAPMLPDDPLFGLPAPTPPETRTPCNVIPVQFPARRFCPMARTWEAVMSDVVDRIRIRCAPRGRLEGAADCTEAQNIILEVIAKSKAVTIEYGGGLNALLTEVRSMMVVALQEMYKCLHERVAAGETDSIDLDNLKRALVCSLECRSGDGNGCGGGD